MTHIEEVFTLITKEPGLTDQQIADRTGMSHTHVCNVCHTLTLRGRIVRQPGPQGKLINLPTAEGVAPPSFPHADGYPAGPILSSDRSGSAPPDPSPASSSPTVGDITRLDSARTLIVLGCSAKKRPEGTTAPGPGIADLLPSALRYELIEARAAIADSAHLDTSALRPAWDRYDGAFYKAAGPAIQAAIQAHTHVLIISGGYGVVLAHGPIGNYNAVFKSGHWKPRLVQRCLVAYARRHNLSAVIAFLDAHTPYADVVRSASWHEHGVADAFLVSPRLAGKEGAMAIVPRAAGEAFGAFRHGQLRPTWLSSKGVGIDIEALR